MSVNTFASELMPLLVFFHPCKYSLDDHFCRLCYHWVCFWRREEKGTSVAIPATKKLKKVQSTSWCQWFWTEQIHFAPVKSNKVDIKWISRLITFLSSSQIFAKASMFSHQSIALFSSSSCRRVMGKLDYFYWREFKSNSPKWFCFGVIWVTESNSYFQLDSQREQGGVNRVSHEESWLTSHLNDWSFEKIPIRCQTTCW